MQMDTPIKAFPSINSVIDCRCFTFSELIDIMELLVTQPEKEYDMLSMMYFNQKEAMISNIVQAEESVAAVKRALDQTQAEYEEERSLCLEQVVKLNKMTVDIESVPCMSNQSGTIVFGTTSIEL